MNSIRIMLAANAADDRKLISGLLTDEALRVVSSFRPDADGLKKASSQPADVLLIGTRAMPSQELDALRRKRNVSDYQGDPIESEAVSECIAQATALLATTRRWLAEHHPDFL